VRPSDSSRDATVVALHFDGILICASRVSFLSTAAPFDACFTLGPSRLLDVSVFCTTPFPVLGGTAAFLGILELPLVVALKDRVLAGIPHHRSLRWASKVQVKILCSIGSAQTTLSRVVC
jgi:hypothetical protein